MTAIDFESDAHAVVESGRVVLIDPLPLEEAALRRLGTVEGDLPDGQNATNGQLGVIVSNSALRCTRGRSAADG